MISLLCTGLYISPAPHIDGSIFEISKHLPRIVFVRLCSERLVQYCTFNFTLIFTFRQRLAWTPVPGKHFISSLPFQKSLNRLYSYLLPCITRTVKRFLGSRVPVIGSTMLIIAPSGYQPKLLSNQEAIRHPRCSNFYRGLCSNSDIDAFYVCRLSYDLILFLRILTAVEAYCLEGLALNVIITLKTLSM